MQTLHGHSKQSCTFLQTKVTDKHVICVACSKTKIGNLGTFQKDCVVAANFLPKLQSFNRQVSSTILSANCGLYLSKLQNHYSLGYFGIQLHLADAFSSVNVINQIFIMKHRPVAPGWRVSRTSVAMCTCIRIGHNFCNSHGLVLSFMSTYEF